MRKHGHPNDERITTLFETSDRSEQFRADYSIRPPTSEHENPSILPAEVHTHLTSLLNLLADTQLYNDSIGTTLESDQASAPPASIAEWVPEFKPFSSSLIAFDVERDGSANSPSLQFEGNSGNTNQILEDTAPIHSAHLFQPSDGFPSVSPAPELASAFSSDAQGTVKLHDDGLVPNQPNPNDLVNDPTPTAPISTHDAIDTNVGSVDFILAGGNSTTATSTSTGTTSTTTTTSGGSAGSAGLVIKVNYDSSVASAPAGFTTAVGNVVAWFESHFSDPVTININVGYGEVGGQTMGSGALGRSLYFVDSFNYSTVKNALVADAKSTSDLSSVATLPSTDPTNGGTFYVSTADAKALGLDSGSSTDGYVGFSNTVAWDYNNTDGVTSGTYDFMGTVFHEISEVLGRETMNGQSATYYPLDLFHYAGSGVRTFSGTTTGYFSVDNGKTNLGNFNTNSAGDFGDWASNVGNDAALAFSNSGVVNSITARDVAAMDILGWDLVSTAPVVASTAPVISVSLAVDTGNSSIDKITSNATIAGTGNANAVVTITEGTTKLGTTTANSSGAWTFSPLGLTNGSHTLTASETGSSGTIATASLTFTLDTTAPVAPTITSFSTDSGLVGDHVTNDNTLTLTGTAEANATVKVHNGTTLLGSAIANSSGVWTYTTPALVNGVYGLTATATDAAGNTGAASNLLSVTVDTTAPVAPTIASFSTDTGVLGDHITSDNTPTLTGTAEVNSTVKVYDGATLLGHAVAGGTGSWSFTTAALSGGDHTLTATATDAAGNISGSSSAFSITINTAGTVIEAFGSTSLVEVSNHYYLDNISTGSGPTLKAYGVDFVAGQWGAWTPIATEHTASGYLVAWNYTGTNTYTVWNTDSNGNDITTTGSISGSSSTLESLELSFHQDLNGDGVIGVGTVIEAFGSTSLVEASNHYYLDNISTGSGPTLKAYGVDYVAGQWGAWTPIATEHTASGYLVAWHYTGTNTYTVWNTDSNGNAITATGSISGSSSTLESLELSFHQDLNGDGVVGVGTVIEASGSSSLVEVSNHYHLDNISTGSGPTLKAYGVDYVAGQWGAWTPIATEQTVGGYLVAWKYTGTNTYTVWNTDSNGNALTATGSISGSSSTLESLESSFHQDLNGDGVIGVPNVLTSGGTNNSLPVSNLSTVVEQNNSSVLATTASITLSTESDAFKFAALDPHTVISNPAELHEQAALSVNVPHDDSGKTSSDMLGWDVHSFTFAEAEHHPTNIPHLPHDYHVL